MHYYSSACVTKGEPDKNEQLKRKRALWGENDKEIYVKEWINIKR